MNDFEKTIRKYFGLSMEGKLCEECMKKYMAKYRIDDLLRMNASAQMNLGTDATAEDKQKALNTARYVKASIMKYDKTKAESMFPEINLSEDGNTFKG